MTAKHYALLSVTDKSEIVEFGKGLVQLGFTLLSTGGTAKHLRDNGLEVTDVSELTGSPEIMDGRVKTLHPMIHAGILCDRSNPSHRSDLEKIRMSPIDVVAVNLYQFDKKLETNPSIQDAIESIDIGGPTSLRAAAKNADHVLSLVDPNDYQRALEFLQNASDRTFAYQCSAKVFRHISRYDQMIADYWDSQLNEPLRYGENPQQAAAVHGNWLDDAVTVHQGKSLSFNNYLDVDAGTWLIHDLHHALPGLNCLAILKHNNPCAVACSHSSSVTLWQEALAGDPKSSFGGIVVTNQTIDAAMAEAMSDVFLEVVIAPKFDEEALTTFQKKKNLRVITADFLSWQPSFRLQRRTLWSGVELAQEWDNAVTPRDNWQVVSGQLDDQTTHDLRMAEVLAKHVKSNAITIVKEGQSLGLGAGQMSRIDAATLAFAKAEEFKRNVDGAVLGSDGFFPFADSVEYAASKRIKAIIQPGGSMRDEEVIAMARNLGITMVLTGTRHFRH